jgi:hypothetical protein
MADEINGCATVLRARLGVAPETFAYPYGDAPLAARAAVRETFACAVTTDYRVLDGSDAFDALPRLDMYYFQHPSAMDGWGQPAFRARLASRRVARRVGALVRRSRGER